MRSRQILAFIYRDLKLVFTDKIALFWLIAWPLIWVFMVAYIFVPPGAVSPVKLDVGVINNDVSSNTTMSNFTSKDFVEIMENVTYKGEKMFNVIMYNDTGKLEYDLKHGELDAGIIIPEGFSENLTKGIARLEVLIGARDIYSASINYAVIKGFLDEFSKHVGLIRANITISYIEKYAPMYMNQTGYNNTGFIEFLREYMLGIATPINASYRDVKPEVWMSRENVLGWYVIGGVGMMFLYTGFSQGAAALFKEKRVGTLRRILASPITPGTFLSALILSNIVILVLSAIILIVVGVYGTGAHIVFNPANPAHWLVPVLIFIGALMSLGLGMILSIFAKTEHGADSLGVALVLFLAFTAGIWFPKEWMPEWMQIIANYFPVTWVFDTMRNIMIYDKPLAEITGDLVKIVIGLVMILLIDLVIYKTRIQKYLTTY